MCSGWALRTLPPMFDAFAEGSLSVGATVVLVIALLVAFGFEFVNGFHDTANAVATVIYTKAMKPTHAVLLSGALNFVGVFSGGIAVAIGIIHLLPVDLVVSAGTHRGLAMIAALLLSAIAWNLGTWWLGIPASSSHTLIGAILGVGVASALLDGNALDGVNWHKAGEILVSLLVSPIFGFALAAGVLFAMHRFVKDKRLFTAPEGETPPPPWVRALLILTCGGVSFSHGSNDGQKGGGLVMLILVGIVPAGFAIDLDASAADVAASRAAALEIRELIAPHASACATWGEDERPPDHAAPACLVRHHAADIAELLAAGSVRDIARERRWHVREGTLRIESALPRLEGVPAADLERLRAATRTIARLSEYAPSWVLLAVALALGIGTTVGWKRIVVTVGEKIGKSHLTYAQGAAAELVAASTIGAAAWLGLPVSTTHVLSSGIAGAMVVEKAGVQPATLRKIVLAWVLTLPVCMLLAGGLFALFATLVP